MVDAGDSDSAWEEWEGDEPEAGILVQVGSPTNYLSLFETGGSVFARVSRDTATGTEAGRVHVDATRYIVRVDGGAYTVHMGLQGVDYWCDVIGFGGGGRPPAASKMVTSSRARL